jgi:chain length determinant protein EpsF
MSLGQLISIIRARWWVVLVMLLLVAGAAIGVSMILPKKYSATASVVVDPKPDPLSVAYGGMVSPAMMATQIDIIESERVAIRVARNLKLVDNPQVRAQWAEETGGSGSLESWLAGTFQRHLSVTPSRESNVLTISYTAPDPKFASAMANAFVQAYIDIAVELRTDPAKRYSSFFDSRLKEARDKLEGAQARLSAYQKDKGLTATDERLDIETARLGELSSQLVALEAIATESATRQAAAGTSGGNMPEVLANSLIAGIKADITRQESRLEEMTQRLGDNHPQVIETRASLAELRRRLETETRRVTGGVGVTASINRQRERQLRAELDAQRAKVLRLKGVRDESAVLVRDVENAQRTYDALQARFTQSTLEGQTTQSNVSLLTEATPPTDPSSPKVALNSILGVFFGLLLGMGLALALEFMDRRVRGRADITELIGTPLLGVLPPPGGLLATRRSNAALTQARIVGRLASSARGT